MPKWDSIACILLLVFAVSLTGCGNAATSVTPETPTAWAPVSEIETYLNTSAESGEFRGSVLIAQNGEVLLSKGYGFANSTQKILNTPQTKFRIGSITKQFTAMAILMLQAQGKLDVQDRICVYLSECPAGWEEITIHHLLTHTAGIPNFTDSAEYASTKATPSPPGETIKRFTNKPLDFQPGESWRYSNSGYILLGLIIEQAAGQTYETFLQEKIFIPLKMTATGYDHNRDDIAVGYKDPLNKADFIDMSTPYSAGGLYSTVEDLYRWDQALYTEQLLPQDILKEMFTAYITTSGSRQIDPESFELAYGYGWMIGREGSHRIIEHGGAIDGFVTIITRYPDDKVTIIVLSNQENTPIGLIRSTLARKLFGDK